MALSRIRGECAQNKTSLPTQPGGCTESVHCPRKQRSNIPGLHNSTCLSARDKYIIECSCKESKHTRCREIKKLRSAVLAFAITEYGVARVVPLVALRASPPFAFEGYAASESRNLLCGLTLHGSNCLSPQNHCPSRCPMACTPPNPTSKTSLLQTTIVYSFWLLLSMKKAVSRGAVASEDAASAITAI